LRISPAPAAVFRAVGDDIFAENLCTYIHTNAHTQRERGGVKKRGEERKREGGREREREREGVRRI